MNLGERSRRADVLCGHGEREAALVSGDGGSGRARAARVLDDVVLVGRRNGDIIVLLLAVERALSGVNVMSYSSSTPWEAFAAHGYPLLKFQVIFLLLSPERARVVVCGVIVV